VALMALLGSVMKSANNLNQFVNKEWHTVLTPSSHPGVALKHFLRVDTIFLPCPPWMMQFREL
jgi:hypothetical protein